MAFGEVFGQALVLVAVRVARQIGPVLFEDAAGQKHGGLVPRERANLLGVHFLHLVDLGGNIGGKKCSEQQRKPRRQRTRENNG